MSSGFSGIAVALQGVSAIARAYAQYQAAEAQAAAARAQAEAMKYNAQVAKQNEEMVRQRTSYEAMLIRRQAAALLAKQKQAYASRGFATTTGTPLAIISETSRKLEEDRAMKMFIGDIEAMRQSSTAKLYNMKARSLLSSAGYYEDVGTWGALTTGLAGLGQTAVTAQELGLFTKPQKEPTSVATSPDNIADVANTYGYDWRYKEIFDPSKWGMGEVL